MLINGQWARDFDPVHGTDDEGGFVREVSRFRNWIKPVSEVGQTSAEDFVAESGRYHLYVALICPWACRTLMTRKLKGLDDVISVSVVDPRLGKKVWRFADPHDPFPGTDTDPLYGFEHVYELYLKARADYTGQVTVPVLWDKQRHTIVNNESSEIIRMLNDGFGDFAQSDIDLYPAELRDDIDAVNDRLYDHFNNGVYRAGFATTQLAHERAVGEVFDSLDYIEQRLAGQDYLVGNRLTEADVRAFVTLIRFDLAYYGLFKTNRRMARDYSNIRTYIERIYNLPGIADTVDAGHIKTGYYSIRQLNPSGIVPLGPESLW
jgi:putative glutathione S-transferase